MIEEDFDDALAEVARCKEMRDEALWQMADLAARYILDKAALKAFAGVWGCSRQHMRRMAEVATLFAQDERYSDVPFSLYFAAARTDDPDYWLSEALENGWSAAKMMRECNKRLGRRLKQIWDAVEVRPGDGVSAVIVADTLDEKGEYEVREK